MTPREAYEKAAKDYPDVEFLCGYDVNDEVYVFLTSGGYITVDKVDGFSLLETSPSALLDRFETDEEYCECFNHKMFSVVDFEFIDLGDLYTIDDSDDNMLTEKDWGEIVDKIIKGK